ncbi:helix-turn-helix domain-containing protein [Aliarcobacter cryaerophilus]|uniref:helix-turn-helix transcriptional regulator n=1 Tax=Aliarcobacter cryaerophilus TaxID=28198 RepID=UPI003DA1F9D5
MKNYFISKDEFKEIDFLKKERIFLRVAEASKMFSISKAHFWALVSKNVLKAYRPSPKITLLKTSEIIDYLEQNMESL